MKFITRKIQQIFEAQHPTILVTIGIDCQISQTILSIWANLLLQLYNATRTTRQILLNTMKVAEAVFLKVF